ncbi:IS110 family transposase [Streptomyces sp.]|uniref:IS110 family transposase n=1 Tax=Streptomyces sp. TaxID=1931 RepID=UPI002D780E35|nr:transposase [Streptomyces sp.]HET6355929.1 transposase [Streptomyces sp.]
MVTVGIDPHKHVHVAVAMDADGKRLTRPLTVKNDANLIGVLLKWIRTITDGTPVTWTMEDGRGFARRLADGLLLAGHEVIWVPTRLMAAHRKLHAATGSKSDPVVDSAGERIGEDLKVFCPGGLRRADLSVSRARSVYRRTWSRVQSRPPAASRSAHPSNRIRGPDV